MKIAGNTFSRVSVIICTWNRCASLRRTLDSLSSVDMPEGTDVEVIVVDNNSSDDTRTVAGQFTGGASPWRLRYVFEPRQGKQFALNTGIRTATGQVLAFTDDDVLFDREWLRYAIAVVLDEGADVAGGVTRVDGFSERPCWYSDTMSAVIGSVNLGDAPIDPAPAEYAPAGANLVVNRRAFNMVGMFSERHYRHMDYEFGVRARGCGLRVRYDPRLVVRTGASPGMLTKRYFRRWYFKQGIAAAFDANDTARLTLVPRWMWRQAAEQAWTSLKCRVRDDEAAAFASELRVWHLAGFIASRWRNRFGGRSHGAWAARWSQKHGEQFR